MRQVLLEGRPLPIFPCHENKRPACEHGFKAAVADEAGIEASWRRTDAPLIGVATGASSGIAVVDIDPRNGGRKWLDANHHRLPMTRTHQTRGGGLHLIYRHAPGLRCRQIAPGVDLKADGGYVVWWCAHGGQVLVLALVTELPHWINSTSAASALSLAEGGAGGSLAPVTPSRRALIADLSASSQVNGERMGVTAKSDCNGFEVTPIPPLEAPIDYEINYAKRALGNAFLELRACPVGCRNATLNALAYKMGRLVARGWITWERVETLLLKASEQCGLLAADGLGQCKATIDSGMRAGMTRPYHDIRQRVAS
jgi:Bifunctional DNA primase/polymerase, N-terminal